ncbi:hypothetical protein HK101_006814, partial [Irineochytrium annulatum]
PRPLPYAPQRLNGAPWRCYRLAIRWLRHHLRPRSGGARPLRGRGRHDVHLLRGADAEREGVGQKGDRGRELSGGGCGGVGGTREHAGGWRASLGLDAVRGALWVDCAIDGGSHFVEIGDL